jgi:hypothetical protein
MGYISHNGALFGGICQVVPFVEPPEGRSLVREAVGEFIASVKDVIKPYIWRYVFVSGIVKARICWILNRAWDGQDSSIHNTLNILN